jgi:cell division transport system permease protein
VGVVLKAPLPPHRSIVYAVRNLVRILLAGAVRSWARNLGATAPALGSMTLLLLLSGLVGLSAFALQRLAAAQAADIAVIHVYLRDDARTEDVNALRAVLTADVRVDGVAYTSKAQAMRRAQDRPGLSDLAGAAGDNPFPASLDVHLRSMHDVGALAGLVTGNPAVDPMLPTSFNAGTYERIQRALAVMALAGAAFLLLLGFVAVTVTANSIRAAIYARREELSIMELVGAPRWMVRGPFLVEGALTGGVAGLMAAGVTLGVSLTAVSVGASTFAQVAPGLTAGVCLVAAGAVLAAGLGLGATASLLSVHRQLERL